MAVRLISNFRTVVASLEKSLPTQVMRACHEVRNEWLNVLSGARSGRYYRIPGTHRKRRSGAAGRVRAQAPTGGWQEGMATEIGAASLLATAGRAGFYRASAPGEAPAQRLGDLRQSIRIQPRIEPGRIQARVGSLLEYAVYLEYGTETMQPRPHLRIAYERARPRIDAIFREGLI